jgi:FtsZ-binding cell division protein ZapB
MPDTADVEQPVGAEDSKVAALMQEVAALQKAAKENQSVVNEANQLLQQEREKAMQRMQQMAGPIDESLQLLSGNSVSSEEQVKEAANAFKDYLRRCTDATADGPFNRAHEQQVTLVHCFSAHAIENQKLKAASEADAECIKRMGMEIESLKAENKRMQDKEADAYAEASAKSQKLSLFSKASSREAPPAVEQRSKPSNDLFEWVKTQAADANTQFKPNADSNLSLLSGKVGLSTAASSA